MPAFPWMALDSFRVSWGVRARLVGNGLARAPVHAPRRRVCVRSFLASFVACVVATLLSSGPATGASINASATAIEYYRGEKDHYFITADPDEQNKLDTGALKGWVRTGYSIPVLAAGDVQAGSSPVCRFYGNPAAGLDSHFYSASPTECDEVRRKYPDAWLFEAPEVFRAYLPDAVHGNCAAGLMPVYRAFNNRTDANHRYTTSTAVQAQMIVRGYTAEGYGAPPAIMCVPALSPTPPFCTLTVSSATPAVGTSLVLAASCTGAPTVYHWSGCASQTSVCSLNGTAPGPAAYSVIAENGAGPSNAAVVLVNWTGAVTPSPTPVRACALTASNPAPIINTTIQLTVNCTGFTPIYLVWINCSVAGSACTATAAVSGRQLYQVTADGVLTDLEVDWQPRPDVAGLACTGFAETKVVDATWLIGPSGNQLTSAKYGPLLASRPLVVRITPSSLAGLTRVFGSVLFRPGVPGVTYTVSVSMNPCDWSGSLGPGAVAIASDPNNASAYIHYAIPLGLGAPPPPGFLTLTGAGTHYVNVKADANCIADCAGPLEIGFALE